MRLSLRNLVDAHGLELTGVVHVGAHLAEEADDYAALDLPVLWIEGVPELIPRIRQSIARHPMQVAVCGLIGEHDFDMVPFFETSNDGMSSSIYPLGDLHRRHVPQVTEVRSRFLPTVTLRTVLNSTDHHPWESANLLNLDIQGAELVALSSLPGTHWFAKVLRYIYTEVSVGAVYEGGAQLREMDSFLEAHGFSRVETELDMLDGTHGDALYVREPRWRARSRYLRCLRCRCAERAAPGGRWRRRGGSRSSWPA